MYLTNRQTNIFIIIYKIDKHNFSIYKNKILFSKKFFYKKHIFCKKQWQLFLFFLKTLDVRIFFIYCSNEKSWSIFINRCLLNLISAKSTNFFQTFFFFLKIIPDKFSINLSNSFVSYVKRFETASLLGPPVVYLK